MYLKQNFGTVFMFVLTIKKMAINVLFTEIKYEIKIEKQREKN